MTDNANSLFGRRWQLDITGQSKKYTLSSDQEKGDPLRVRFRVHTKWYEWYWTADIEIWNPNEQLSSFFLSQGSTATSGSPPTQASQSTQPPPIQQGMQVSLQAGYQSPGQYGEIFNGFVLQPMFDRVNQTDFVVTLHCIIGLIPSARNSISDVYGPSLTQMQIIQQMAKKAYYPISTGTIASSLSNKSLSFHKVVFGSPKKFFKEIAEDNNMQTWLESKSLWNVGDLIKDFPKEPKYTFTPKTGIVGTPQQQQFGVRCRLLLNPNVKVSNPPMAVKIDNTVIQQLQVNPGDWSALSVLSQTNTYCVVEANYFGDTRGNEWYTDFLGWQGLGEAAALYAQPKTQVAQ